MDFVAQRLHRLDMDASTDSVPANSRLNESLRSVLLDRILNLYLKALSRLPMEDFWAPHHRTLLKAGYLLRSIEPC
ncbi:Os04g0177500 [Oryza sativa Japonica Group]|jgi:hypothetical protein|uniref:Os04g0177500 protein n=1 Tax=Oryza sativa subsp. japonica TaxID=39947 RepID=A0A0P0W6Z0_ORYSJ|nr:hypothetical protein EE612_022273 [Oryza sativa]BAS87943.1 Os04g0177500 [Oryza sativa Japonica Group]